MRFGYSLVPGVFIILFSVLAISPVLSHVIVYHQVVKCLLALEVLSFPVFSCCFIFLSHLLIVRVFPLNVIIISILCHFFILSL